MIHNIFSAHSNLSPSARKAWAISRQLFKAKAMPTDQIEALIAIDGDAIAPFRMALAKDGSRHGSARREQVVDAIGSRPATTQHRSTTIALLASFMDDQEGMVGAKAVAHLTTYGPQVGGLLLKALAIGNRWSRSYAARALGTLGGIRAVSGLITALQDDDKRVRSDAAEALGKIGDSQATQPLFSALTDPNWLVRESASSALATFSDQEIIDKLTHFLDSDDHRVRAQAVHTLSNMDSPASLAPLISALDDPHFEVQWDAVDALATLNNSTAIPALLAHYHQGDKMLRHKITTGCITIGIHHVAAQLIHPNSNIRIASAEMIGQQQKINLLDDLTHAWHQERDNEAQMWLMIAIGQLATIAGERAPKLAIEALIEGSQSSHHPVRYHATKALESLRHPLAEQHIKQPTTPTKITIQCPSCLHPLQLQPPLTGKQWHCTQCHLGFSMRQGSSGNLIVTPNTVAPAMPSTAHPSQPWFEVLQVEPNADAQTIQLAFRTLLKQCHPDKVASLGAEFQQLAEQKTRRLTQAFRAGLEERQHKK
ncbi:MAG: HEAT repeat domain-containing protein [Mariprofundales bacterium]